jgi:hypothetical protein
MRAGLPRPSAGVNFQKKELMLPGFGLVSAISKVAMEAETQIDILGEIADIDPDFDGLVERCSEWLTLGESVEDDVIQYGYD